MTQKEDFLKKFTNAFAYMDLEVILTGVTDDVEWEIIGEKTVRGKKAMVQAFQEEGHPSPLEVSLSDIITHGKLAAANGSVKFKEPSGKIRAFRFADFYEFKGFKNPLIRKMTSYMIPIETN